MKKLGLVVITMFASGCIAQEVDLDSLVLADGFSIAVYAKLAGPRQMALGEDNVVYVGHQRGRVSAVIDQNHDGVADHVVTVAEGLNRPNGVAYHEGDLYIGEIHRISKISAIASKLAGPSPTETVNDSLPRDQHHGMKFLQIGPDAKLYLPIGAPCNVCEVAEQYAGIYTMNLDGSDLTKIADGVRNSVGFDWHPATGEFWFTDNGRDMLGDNIPACEINRLTRSGQHFGFPFIHQGDLPDPVYGAGKNIDDYTAPVLKLGAHVAPLGMVFYRGEMFPDEYSNTLFWAEHGSWNRREKSGYKIMMGRVSGDNSRIIENSPFVEGWLQGQSNWGRPVDVLNMPDGAVLISDDMAGVIYRVTYN